MVDPRLLVILAIAACGGGGGGGGSGDSCSRPEDCDNGQCVLRADADGNVTATGVCAGACTSAVFPAGTVCGPECTENRCTPGWSCITIDEDPICYCTPDGSAEVCDDADNDCNGVLDDPELTDSACVAENTVGFGCERGRCIACPERCDGTCTDTTADVANCGTCGNACAVGDACVGGECLITEDLITIDGFVGRLATDGVNLFWSKSFTVPAIERCAITDCGATRTGFLTVADGAANVLDLEVSAGEVVFITGGELRICPPAGCTTGVRIPVPENPALVASDATQIFVGTNRNSSLADSIFRCTRASCAATMARFYIEPVDTGALAFIALDASSLYFGYGPSVIGGNGSSILSRCPHDDCTAPAPAMPDTPTAKFRSLAGSPEGVTFSGSGNAGLFYFGAAEPAARSIGGNCTGNSCDPGGLAAVDANFVYRVTQDSDDNSVLAFCPVGGCPLGKSPLVTRPLPKKNFSTPAIYQLEVDATHIYWADYTVMNENEVRTTLHRIRKPVP